MTFLAIVGSAAVAATLPLLWWALSGERAPAGVARNLTSGLGGPVDVRSQLLARSATDRALAPAVERWAARVRRVTPVGRIEALERRILLAGSPRSWTIERLLAAKLLLGVVGLGFGLLRLVGAPGALSLLIAVGGPVVGWFAPDGLLAGRADRRQTAIRRALPDTLDQLTISVEAGLGFEAALVRAGRSGKGPLAEELLRTLQDVQAGMSRNQALHRLIERTDVEELQHFVLAVSQAESYGVPIAQVLRVQSVELRVKRRQQAEERAAKMPVKILFPVVLCILPTVFIVLLGPAAIRISNTLGG
jgi:tight adherence protein C